MFSTGLAENERIVENSRWKVWRYSTALVNIWRENVYIFQFSVYFLHLLGLFSTPDIGKSLCSETWFSQHSLRPPTGECLQLSSPELTRPSYLSLLARNIVCSQMLRDWTPFETCWYWWRSQNSLRKKKLRQRQFDFEICSKHSESWIVYWVLPPNTGTVVIKEKLESQRCCPPQQKRVCKVWDVLVPAIGKSGVGYN